MKYSVGISNFLDEISSLSHSVFFYFFALIAEEAFLICPCYSLELCIQMLQFSSVQLLSRVRLFVTPWTGACQAPPSMGFSRQEYWSELPLPSPGELPDPGMEPRSPALQADLS